MLHQHFSSLLFFSFILWISFIPVRNRNGQHTRCGLFQCGSSYMLQRATSLFSVSKVCSFDSIQFHFFPPFHLMIISSFYYSFVCLLFLILFSVANVLMHFIKLNHLYRSRFYQHSVLDHLSQIVYLIDWMQMLNRDHFIKMNWPIRMAILILQENTQMNFQTISNIPFDSLRWHL